MKRVGIFGGTFNPVHYGHLKMAEAARKEYKLSVVYFVPCGIPPHKSKEKLIPKNIRYRLLLKAIKGKKYFKVLDIEIKKKKPAYTIDTIRELNSKKAFKNKRLYFLIGADEFEKLNKWKSPQELSKFVSFIVLPRPTKNIQAPKIKNLRWHLVHTKPINISSSDIRNRIKSGKPVTKFIPWSDSITLRQYR